MTIFRHNSTTRSLARRVFWSVALASTMLIGCSTEKGGPVAPDEEPEVRTLESDSTESETPKKAASARKNGSVDAARILGDATSRFSKTFTDDEESEAGTDDANFDMSLVDEETRRKYTDDRTLVAPTLEERDDDQKERYRLEYRFEPNSNLTWNVSHLVRKHISYGGRESLIETSSTTYRRWEFLDAAGDGKGAARHWIDRIVLQQNEEGKDPIDYDSDRDIVAPREISAFGTEKAVGVVLETFEIDPRGVMSNKKKLVAEYQGREEDSTVFVPLPDAEVGVGDVWTVPYALYLKGTDKVARPYRVVERFRLENIDERYATISFKTTLLSIVDDPVVEGELAERLFSGKALFDRELGLTTRTELNFNKTVPGAFGFSSFLEYNCQVVEKLMRDESGAPLRTPATTAPRPSESTGEETVDETAEPAADAESGSDEPQE